MRRISILLAGLALLTSCGNDKDKLPAGILKPAKMQAVLWDVIKADVFTTGFIKTDSAKNATAENLKLQQQVFAIHKVTRADFYSSYDYYKKDPVAFKKIMDSMVTQAERTKLIKTQPLQIETKPLSVEK